MKIWPKLTCCLPNPKLSSFRSVTLNPPLLGLSEKYTPMPERLIALKTTSTQTSTTENVDTNKNIRPPRVII